MLDTTTSPRDGAGIPFSLLDLSPIVEGQDAKQALRNTLDLARHAESWGYKRFWLAEHHNMSGIASAATSVVIGYVAGGTTKIRVGAGGVMLPNHAPLVIAEQFGTLESLYPGRIDLGLGRAPGSDQLTARALRRDLQGGADSFPRDVQELQSYFEEAAPHQRVRAVPGAGLHVPLWLLGSSLYSAQLAAALGLPFAFASHFAPDLLMQALQIYRERFQPSAQLEQPYAMVAANFFLAASETEAQRLFTSIEQAFVNLRRGQPGPLPAPLEGAKFWSNAEQENIDYALACSFIGTPDSVREDLQRFIANTGADEILVTAQIFDNAARLRSFGLAATLLAELNLAPVT